MRTAVARHAFNLFSNVNQAAHFFITVVQCFKIVAGFQRFFQRNAQLARYHFGNIIHKAVSIIQRAPYITHSGTRLQGTEGNNLRHALLAVAFDDIIQHSPAVHVAKISINIRHAYAFWVQKTFKKQIVFQRVDVGNTKQVRHNASRRTAAPRPDRDIVLAAVIDKVPYNQKIAAVTHAVDYIKLVIQTLHYFFIRIGVTRRQTLHAQAAQVFRGVGKLLRYRKLRQQQMPKLQRHIAALRNFNGVFQSLRTIGKALCHFVIAF